MLIVVLTRVLTPPAPLLLLLVVLTRVLAPLAPLLMLIFVLTCVFAPLAPLLLLLVVLTHVLAQLGGLCVHCVVVQCCKIAPNSSLQDWLAFAVDKEPFSLVYNRNEDSFNHAMSIITHYQMRNRTVSSGGIALGNDVKTNVPTVKSTNECVVVSKKYLYCIYLIMYCKNSINKN
jgi:hypothetical protein